MRHYFKHLAVVTACALATACGGESSTDIDTTATATPPAATTPAATASTPAATEPPTATTTPVTTAEPVIQTQFTASQCGTGAAPYYAFAGDASGNYSSQKALALNNYHAACASIGRNSICMRAMNSTELANVGGLKPGQRLEDIPTAQIVNGHVKRDCGPWTGSFSTQVGA